jgi:twinkle protein
MSKTLGRIGVKAFENRKIDPELVARLGVYTASRGIEDGSVMPDPKGNVIVFPFFDGGVSVSEKYRAPNKIFWQQKGGKRTFWNADVMDDPALIGGHQALVITEGEIDAITAIDCGHPFTVSVPDGAPSPPTKKNDEPAQTESDQAGKFEFMWNNRDRLKRIKRFILAVDNDAPGKHLASELVRRLSAARCYFVTYPEGCKDLSDVRVSLGAEAVTAVLNAAQPYPVKDLYSLSDFPDAPAIRTFDTGWATIDPLMKLFTPCFAVVTGIPSHGKSTWLTHLLINASEMHGWKTAIFSPEMPVVPHLRDKMRRIIARTDLERMTREEQQKADRWINEYFVFIEHMAADDDLTLEWLIDRAEEAVMRYGIKAFVIDPWNEVEHAKRRDETMTEYISRGLRMLKRFQTRYDVAVFVVAHPTKDVGFRGVARAPSLYDIDGSAAWFNKPDIGIIIDRPDSNVNESVVHIAKVRFEGTGRKGSVRMRFDSESSRYDLLEVR